MIKSLFSSQFSTLIQSMFGDKEGFVDPVPDFLFHYLMDGNDSALTPINSPLIVAGLELPDKLASSFNGVDQRYTSTEGSVIATLGTGPFTWAFWMNSNNSTKVQGVASTGAGSNSDDFRIRLTGAGKIQLRTTSFGLTSNLSIVANTDYHVVIASTGAGGSMRMYINNVLDITTLLAPMYNFDTNIPLEIASVGGSQFWDGEIDGIRLYNRELTPSERLALLNNV